jgi:hypothetical protein
MVILGGASSTHPLGKERNRKLKAGVTVTWVEYERKVKSGNAKKGWSSVEGMNVESWPRRASRACLKRECKYAGGVVY